MRLATSFFFPVLLAGFLLAGCIKQNVATTIESDGSGTNVIILAVHKQAMEAPGGGTENPFGDVDAARESMADLPESWNLEIKEYEDDTFIGIRITSEFATLEELEEQLNTIVRGPAVGEGEGDAANVERDREPVLRDVEVVEENGTVRLTAQAGMPLPEDADEQDRRLFELLAGNTRLRWSVALPRVIEYSPQANATHRGGAVHFEFDLGKSYEVEVVGELGASSPEITGIDPEQLESYLEGDWRFERESLRRTLRSEGRPVEVMLPGLMQQVHTFADGAYTVTAGEERQRLDYTISKRDNRALTLEFPHGERAVVWFVSVDRIELTWGNHEPLVLVRKGSAEEETTEHQGSPAEWILGRWRIDIDSTFELMRAAGHEIDPQEIEEAREVRFAFDGNTLTEISPNHVIESEYNVIEESENRLVLGSDEERIAIEFLDRNRIRIASEFMATPIILVREEEEEESAGQEELDLTEWIKGEWRFDADSLRQAFRERGVVDPFELELLLGVSIYFHDDTVDVVWDDDESETDPYTIVEQTEDTLILEVDGERVTLVRLDANRGTMETIGTPGPIVMVRVRPTVEELIVGRWTVDREWAAEQAANARELEELLQHTLVFDGEEVRFVERDEVTEYEVVDQSESYIVIRNPEGHLATITFLDNDRIEVEEMFDVTMRLVRVADDGEDNGND